MSCNTLFIGPFAPPNNGDGVKNAYLKEGFEAQGFKDFVWLDTINRQGSKQVLFIKLFWQLLMAKQIIFSLNIKGRFYTLPFFWMFKWFRRKKGVLYVVGGSFDIQLERMSRLNSYFFLKVLKSLDGIFVESESLKAGVEKFGLQNVIVIYNPRKDSGDRWNLNQDIHHKGVFVSRVTKTKGVSILGEAVVNLAKQGVKISLDVYGPMDETYEAEFQELVASSDGLIQYKGVISPQEVQSTLVNYHFLALPTYHWGEGLPGILVEAGLAGVPIVITRFNALTEYFTHGESALFVDPKDVEGLENGMKELVGNDPLAKGLSEGILHATASFRSDHVMKQSVEFLTGHGWKLS
jgi:glycosyltransferase involved in cell wall biosynthesis